MPFTECADFSRQGFGPERALATTDAGTGAFGDPIWCLYGAGELGRISGLL
jgi:hypothetical protein